MSKAEGPDPSDFKGLPVSSTLEPAHELSLGAPLWRSFSIWLPGCPPRTGPFPSTRSGPAWSAVGRTVFEGDRLDEFKVHILGVLRNVIGPRRNLILARLEGGPLANTGVIAGMSGSPVYIDGRLVGAVSYSLGAVLEGTDRRHHADRRDDRGRHALGAAPPVGRASSCRCR